MKIKLTNILRGKERKERKIERIDIWSLIEVVEEGLYTSNFNYKGRRTRGKAKK